MNLKKKIRHNRMAEKLQVLKYFKFENACEILFKFERVLH